MLKPKSVPEGTATVAVLGAGTIGASWAALFLAAGVEVTVYDAMEGAEQRLDDYVERAWPQLRALGLLQPSADRSRRRFCQSPEDAVRLADFVQESVPERLQVKHDLFRRIEPALRQHAIVASNASGLMIRDMQDAWNDPSRLVLGHPFNPPQSLREQPSSNYFLGVAGSKPANHAVPEIPVGER
jgi:3-hydroxybutyryl-CoA dehydrogenase